MGKLKKSKIGVSIIYSGVVFGMIAGVAMVFAALDHNPHNMYGDDIGKLAPIFYGCMAFISLPFTILGCLFCLFYRKTCGGR